MNKKFSLYCVRCEKDVFPKVVTKSGQFVGYCPDCKCYIKCVSKKEMFHFVNEKEKRQERKNLIIERHLKLQESGIID